MVKNLICMFLIFSFSGCSRGMVVTGEPSVAGKTIASGEAVIVRSGAEESPLFDLSYPPKIVRDAKYTPPSREQKLWALATCALITEVNQRRHDLLGGREQTVEGIEEERESLAEWWDIKNQDDLLKVLKWIEEGGHRKAFDELAEFVGSLSPGEFSSFQEQIGDDNEKACAVDAVKSNYKELGSKSIAGWDYARYVALCGWGYYVGYLSEDEAWARIMPAARLLQQTFTSWDDLGRNYLIGRQFWSYEQTRRGLMRFLECYMKLSVDPASPWVKLPWNLDLRPQK